MFRIFGTAFIVALSLTFCETGTCAPTNTLANAEQNYITTRTAYLDNPQPTQNVISFIKACADYADRTTNNDQRARVANEGIDAARRLIARQPGLAAAHYYLAINLGHLAQSKKKLGFVKEMESEFLQALKYDERYDYAGPNRSLGLLYNDAPGWPLSIGSRSKSKQHFLRAIDLYPDYPDNRLSLIEAALKWGDLPLAQQEFSLLKENLPQARTTFSGTPWKFIWEDWQQRFNAIESKLQKNSE